MNPTLEQIWHEFSAQLGQCIRTRVADPATAEDVLQDAFDDHPRALPWDGIVRPFGAERAIGAMEVIEELTISGSS